jgi:transcriptional regulator with XRE-family HTH domain
MSKIISDNNFVLDAFNPYAIAKGLAVRMRERRLELNLTQRTLAGKSGVSLGTLKRFENGYEISLKHLLMLAVVLDATEEFFLLFTKRQYESIDEVMKASAVKKRQRGKRSV